jgi:CheY-like chemotaxis protein
MSVAHFPHVMVADHYNDTRSLLKFWLETKGCRVVEAMNGQEAVELIKKDCPDLVLMNLRMPVLDGLDATRRIREQLEECHVPIAAISTYPSAKERAAALAAGCNWFISDPTDFDKLSELLRTLQFGANAPPVAGNK